MLIVFIIVVMLALLLWLVNGHVKSLMDRNDDSWDI